MLNSIFLGVIGPNQILIVAVVVILLFGARKIPQLMKGIGQGIKEFKDAKDGIEKDEKKDENKSIES
jgi:sec-independent protein translocase protein TatA